MKQFFSICALFFCVALAAVAQPSNKFTTFSTANTPAFTGDNFKCVGIGKDNQIWAGTQYQGLYKFDTLTKAWSKSGELSNVFINQITRDRDSGIWIAQSGTSGTIGGGSNTGGGINYFPTTADAGMIYYSNALTSGGFISRNTRSVFIDTFYNAANKLPRVWGAFATFITSSATSAGGVGLGLNSNPAYFRRLYKGLQEFPNTNIASIGTPSCYGAAGDGKKVYIAVEQNYQAGPTSQLLMYDAATGGLLGGFDNLGAFDNSQIIYKDAPRHYTDYSSDHLPGTFTDVLPTSFRATALYMDAANRLWIGLRNGGLIVKDGDVWTAINTDNIFPSGAMVNFNAITSDEYGYVYIGTNNGLLVFDGGGAVNSPANYRKFTTLNGLPSNNITGICYDKFRGQVVLASDAGITFWEQKYKIDVSMQWDYSFPDRINQPVGVAADGVARIYLKVRKASDTLPEIKEVNMSVANWLLQEANVRGKLKKATVIDAYSEEASDGTNVELTTTKTETKPGKPGEFWFWYVAPDDFSNDSLSNFANLDERYDSVRVIVTYVNDKKDTVNYKIRVVRPPLLLQHGFNGYPYVWDDFGFNGVPFLSSNKFRYKHAPTLDPKGSAMKAAYQLLAGDDVPPGSEIAAADKLNTLQGNIEQIRKMNFACNQVDFVCHSMGGLYIRSAIGIYPFKFYAGKDYAYRNYQKGFTHKIITINTPHNGSPVADMVGLITTGPDPLHLAMYNLYRAALWGIGSSAGNLVEPVDPGSKIFSRMKLTDATRDLQVTDANGGKRMLLTKQKNHVIAGDVDGLIYTTGGGTKVTNFDLGAADVVLNQLLGILAEMMYARLCLPGVGNYILAEQFKKEVLDNPTEVKVFTWLDWFSDKKGYPKFVEDGDLIVPLGSELARESENLPNVTVFHNTGAAGVADAYHSAVIRVRPDIGKFVFNLLNTKLASPLFGDTIAANRDEEPGELYPAGPPSNAKVPSLNAPTQNGEFYDTSKIRIDLPTKGGSVYADSLLKVVFRVKDTSRLSYVAIRFQWGDSLRFIKTKLAQTIPFTISADLSGVQRIMAVAVYNKPEGGLDYYIDSFTVIVDNKATLQDFRVRDQPVQVKVGTPVYPPLEVMYNNTWITLPNDDPGISVGIDSTTIVSYDADNKTLNGQKEGSAQASFTYKGFIDSVVIQSILPLANNCINRTIASGNYSNPAIWSKGFIPDVCDSVIISSGHVVTVDTSVVSHALRINLGGTLTISSANRTLQLGQNDDGNSMLDNYGTLNISNGTLVVRGRVKLNAASTFNMTGGTLKIDGNTGIAETAVLDGLAEFEAAASMQAFTFSGGTLQIVDPPLGASSQTINSAYNFGANSTLILGNGVSTTVSNNTSGFGGTLFPNKIGKLVIDATIRTGNRQFITKKALTVKGSLQVKAGSGVVQEASLRVEQ